MFSWCKSSVAFSVFRRSGVPPIVCNCNIRSVWVTSGSRRRVCRGRNRCSSSSSALRNHLGCRFATGTELTNQQNKNSSETYMAHYLLLASLSRITISVQKKIERSRDLFHHLAFLDGCGGLPVCLDKCTFSWLDGQNTFFALLGAHQATLAGFSSVVFSLFCLFLFLTMNFPQVISQRP